ncbi:MAG: CoA transferase [Chloroflexota bacterium]|nr:CoA transferase [Chloroflexota bacterium]
MQRIIGAEGFGAPEVAQLWPGIIYVSENAYGHDGPWRHRPGWEQLAQAATGVTVIQGSDLPAITPAAMNDYTTGYFGALGVMMALRRRAMDGGSWRVTVSVSQTSMWYLRLGYDLDGADAAGHCDMAALLEECDTPYGEMRRLRPSLRMSETPPHWAIPCGRPCGNRLTPHDRQNRLALRRGTILGMEHQIGSRRSSGRTRGAYAVDGGRLDRAVPFVGPSWFSTELSEGDAMLRLSGSSLLERRRVYLLDHEDAHGNGRRLAGLVLARSLREFADDVHAVSR